MKASPATYRHRLGRLGLPLRERRWRYQRAHPPRLLFGWTIGPPHFVGVGVQKAGTTWWYHLITRHPKVVTRGHPKEMHYFSTQRFATDFEDVDAQDYSKWFPTRRGTVAGEWTPGYMQEAPAIERLHRAAPRARILVLLRDPVDRYRSGMAMMTPRNYPNAEPDARARGLYGTQLERLFSIFPREQVLVLQYEVCAREPDVQIKRTYRFLGLDDSFVPPLLRRRINISMDDFTVDARLKDELVTLYEPEVERVQSLCPGIDIGAWPNFRHLA